MMNEFSEEEKNNPSIEYHAKKQVIDNIFPLPPGHVLARQILPESRSDLVDVNRHAENIICAAYGVPRSNFINDSGISENSAKISDSSFSQNVNYYGKILSRILSGAYEEIYGKEDLIETLRSYKEREKDLTESELIELPEKEKVTVQFLALPFVSTDDIIKHYAFGSLDWKEADQMIKTSCGYPKTESTEDPWNKFHKASILNSSEGANLRKLGVVANVVFPTVSTEKQVEEKDKGKQEKKKEKVKTPTKKRKQDKVEVEEKEPKKLKK